MDASSLFASGNARYVAEDYEEALKHYTCAVTLQDDCAEYHAYRAAAYLKLGRKEEALKDTDEALKLEPRHHMALHWRGMALFHLESFAAAKQAFEESLRNHPAGKAPRNIWIRKCDAELSGSTLPLAGLSGTSKPASVPTPAPAPVPRPAPAPEAPSTASTSADQGNSLTISGRKPIRREWYQSDSQVFVTIFQKDVDADKCKVDFQEKDLSLSFPVPGSESDMYNLDLELFNAIVPSSCTSDVSKMKVEITLTKKLVGVRWGGLEKKEEVDLSSSDALAQPAYPSSNKAKRDWNSIDKDIEKQEKEEKPQGDEALNGLFKQIYDRADEDTRRAMNKSFQTSGGTVLSTNWGEVARSDYEDKDRPTAPEGQEWKSHHDK